MNKRQQFILLLLSLLYVVYHLLTLSYSPLPWFDEVSFASITNSYIKAHTFYQEAMTIDTPGQNSMYGPMFFALQAGIIKLLGWSMFNFRLSNLLFGFINIYLFYKICRHLRFPTAAIAVSLIIIALDRSYNQFLHSGRMDYMTIFFFLASYLSFIKIPAATKGKAIALSVFTGFLMACALLTTPRIIFAFSFYFFYSLYDLYEHRRQGIAAIILKYGIILLTLGVFFYLWVWYEFGSLHNYVFVNYTSNERVRRHVGVGHEDNKLNAGMLYFAYAIICLAVLVIKKKLYEYRELLLLTVPVIATFLLLVGGGIAGRYYAMITPFVTILFVGISYAFFSRGWYRSVNYTIIGLLAFAFVAKVLYVFNTYQDRDPAYNERRVMQYIPAGSSVAADFEYYYFARRNNCYFQSVKENGLPNTVLNYYRGKKYDYFIFNKNNQELDNFKTWSLAGRYKLIATIDDAPKTSALSGIITQLGYKITESYACYIYKYNGDSSDTASAVYPPTIENTNPL